MITLLDYSFTGELPHSVDAGAWNTGTVSQTGGVLRYAVGSGDNTDWWNSIQPQRGKRPYFTIPELTRWGVFYIETEIAAYSSTKPSESHLNFMLWQDSQNCHWIYTHGDGNIHVYTTIGNAWTYLGGLAASLPRRVRFIWDRMSRTVAYQYWTGSAWASIYTTQSSSLAFTQVCWYLKSWTGATATGDFGHIKIDADVPVRDWPDHSTSPDEPITASIEEQARYNYPRVGGLTERGTRLPGAGVGDIEDGFGTQAAPKISVEEQVRVDQRALYSTPLGDPQKNPSFDQTISSVEEALRLAQSKITLGPNAGPTNTDQGKFLPARASVEEEAYQDTTEQTALDFSPYTTDGDGRTHIESVGVNHVFLYDTTGEEWAGPTSGNGFHCAGRNGRFYYDGNECGPALNGESFGTLAGGYNNRTWMIDVEPNAIAAWVTQMAMSLVADNTIKFNSTTPQTTWDWGKWISSRHRWCLVGDFDIQFDWLNRSCSGGSDGGTPVFQVSIDDNNVTFIRMNVSSGNIWSDCMINGSWGQGSGSATPPSAVSGKFRITRAGQVVNRYYWNGSSWVQVATSNSAVLAKPVQVLIGCGGTGNLVITRVDVTNFTINSGTPVNTAGWAREAAGTTRGSRADFPEKALIVSTYSSVDIIDHSTSKLWMRFSRGANNALHNASLEPRRTTMKNGLMLVSYGSGGGTVQVDFTRDDIAVHATQGQTWTGARLRTYNGVYWGPTDRQGRDCGAHGIICSRNLAGGYSGDSDNWRIPSESVRWTHVHEQGGYLYKIHATAAGIGVTKWRRWYNDGALGANWWSPIWFSSTETGDMWWCWVDPADETLYYLVGAAIGSISTLYSVPGSTWKAVANGGSFTAAASKAVPSTRNFSTVNRGNQAVTEIKVWPSGTVWKADDNGVWSCVWPSGSFALQIGKLSAGAPYPFMPEDALGVGAMQFCKDDSGTDDLAVVDFVLLGGRYQTYVINLSAVEVYARGKLRRARSCSGIGALVNGIVAG